MTTSKTQAMNRLRFRAWHKALKTMIPVSGFNGNGEQLLTVNLLRSINPNGTLVPGNCTVNGEEVILMEFSGLTDKNGVEVFEGDILKCRIMYDYDRFSEPKIVPVTFEQGRFRPMTDTKRTEYRILPLYYDYEVIGNVQENPELLPPTA